MLLTEKGTYAGEESGEFLLVSGLVPLVFC